MRWLRFAVQAPAALTPTASIPSEPATQPSFAAAVTAIAAANTAAIAATCDTRGTSSARHVAAVMELGHAATAEAPLSATTAAAAIAFAITFAASRIACHV